MKKLVLCLLVCVGLCGCSNNGTTEMPTTTPTIAPTEKSDPDEQTEETLKKAIASLEDDKFPVSKLPHDIKYNDKTITLTNIDYYSFKDGKSQELAVVLTLDIKNLSDDDTEWFLEDIESEIYLTNAKNNISNRKMTQIGNLRYTDTKELLMVYVPNLFDSENRFTFEDSHVDVSMKIKQLDTYEVLDQKFNHTEYVDCYADISENDITPLSDAGYSLENFVYKKLQDYVNAAKNVFR